MLTFQISTVCERFRRRLTADGQRMNGPDSYRYEIVLFSTSKDCKVDTMHYGDFIRKIMNRTIGYDSNNVFPKGLTLSDIGVILG